MYKLYFNIEFLFEKGKGGGKHLFIVHINCNKRMIRHYFGIWKDKKNLKKYVSFFFNFCTWIFCFRQHLVWLVECVTQQGPIIPSTPVSCVPPPHLSSHGQLLQVSTKTFTSLNIFQAQAFWYWSHFSAEYSICKCHSEIRFELV